MNLFVFKKRSAYYFFRNHYMLKNITFRIRSRMICNKQFLVTFFNNKIFLPEYRRALHRAEFCINMIRNKSYAAVAAINSCFFSFIGYFWSCVYHLKIMFSAISMTKMNIFTLLKRAVSCFSARLSLLFKFFTNLPLPITYRIAKRINSFLVNFSIYSFKTLCAFIFFHNSKCSTINNGCHHYSLAYGGRK